MKIMNGITSLKSKAAWASLALLCGLLAAEAQDPRGFRGRWNDWGYDAMALDLNAWRVTLQAIASSDNDFKFASDDWDDGIEWTRSGYIPLASVVTAYVWGENTSMDATPGRYYTFAMDNAGYYETGRMIVQETVNAPISILSVGHVVDGSNATVSIGTSAAPSPGETIVVRYSLDDWASSAFAAATGGGTNWAAAIAHASGEVGWTCSYYVLTTTVAEPNHADADLQAIRWNNNGGANYAYVVAGTPPEAPTEQASALQFSNVSVGGLTVAWAPGNGSGRLVVARAGGPVDSAPENGVAYAAHAAFGSGTEMGTGNFAVFAGTGSSVSVAGLAPETTYHFRVYEYNGGGSLIAYTVAAAADNPASVATPAVPPNPVYINEALSSNHTTQDEDGDTPDWVELYNAGTEPVALAGWGLSDDYAEPFKWTFGNATIQAGQFLRVWASSKNRPEGDHLHTSFNISADGEEIILTRPDGTRIDELPPKVYPADVSVGRQPDGTGPWKFFAAPTPGARNTGTGYETILPNPVFSVPGGFYTNNITLELSTPEAGAVIRYTLDGSEPTASSPIYTNALALRSKAGTPNGIADIPTNFQPTGPDYYEGWEPPAGEVFKLNTVRARAFKAGAMNSRAVTQTYLVDAAGTNRYSLPVVSIATDADNLFDNYFGIYVAGYFQNYFQSGDDWERPGTIEFYEPGGALAFSGGIGIRLHGNTTRSRPRKALRIYAREPSTFEYRIFPDKPLAAFDTFILRNGGNDWGNGVIRDLFQQSLAANATCNRQHGRLVVVFINGEYWGLHDLRERYDDGYMEYNYGLGEQEFVQVEIDRTSPTPDIPVYDRGNIALAGDYRNLWDYFEDSGVASSSNYEYVKGRMDVDSFIDLFQAHIFCGNTDWPGNNIRAWRSVATNRAAGAPFGHDARWRYMLYDMDFGFGAEFTYVPGHEDFAQHDTLAYAASPTQTATANHPDATLMFRRLLENSSFCRSFVIRFSDQLNTAYSRAHVTNRWAQWLAMVNPEMAEHAARWRQPVDWNYERNRIRSYGEQRTAAVWGHLHDYFGLGARQNLTVDANPLQGVVRVNTIDLEDGTAGFTGYPWTGSYFTNYPVTLTAQARPGYGFVEWRQTDVSGGALAADQAANYSSWTNGSNKGTGFAPWTLARSGDSAESGFFLGSGWGLYANSGRTAAAIRPFSNALPIAQIFSVQMDHGSIADNRSVGVALQNATGSNLWVFSFTGGDSHYLVNGSGSGIAFTTDPIQIELTLTSATTYSATIAPSGQSATTLTGPLLAPSDQAITRFRAWNYSAGDGSAADFYVDNLQIAALPGTGAPAVYSTEKTIEVTLTNAARFEAVFEAATLIHYWNFNVPATQLNPSFSLVPGAAIAIDTGTVSVVASGTGQDFWGENAQFGDDAGAHLRLNNPIGAVMDVDMPTTGFENVTVRYETRRSGSGAGTQILSYTLDGTNYVPLAALAVAEIPTLYPFDFAEIPGADNNPNFGFRIEFAQGAGGDAGNNRFDNWTVEGFPLDALNLPPEVSAPIAHRSLLAGDDAAALSLTNVFSDPENDPLTFGAVATDAAVAAVEVAGTTLSIAPLQRGGTTVTVSADDGTNPPVATSFYVLVYPEAHPLETGDFTFTAWSSNNPAGAFPGHMLFLQSDQNDPLIDAPLAFAYHIPAADASAPNDALFPYAATARTRLNGMEDDGISFINTGRGRDLGGALAAFDTRNVTNASVAWLGGTILTNARIYAIRLQYRVGLTNDFADILDGAGQPVEYVRNAVAGHTQNLGPVSLPAVALGHEYVQLLWRYYLVSGTSGGRAQLRLDDIHVANGLAPPPTGFTAWQRSEFTEAELADPAVSGPLAAPDVPGIPNLLRYGFGMGRADDYQNFRPMGDVTESGILFRHRRLLALDSGIEYVIEATYDLEDESPWPAAIPGTDLILLGATPSGDGLTETIEYQIPPETLPCPRFFRLRIRMAE